MTTTRLAVLLKDYPFVKGEPYFDRELLTLSNHFKEVILFVNHLPKTDTELRFQLPANTTVVNVGTAKNLRGFSQLVSMGAVTELLVSPSDPVTKLKAMNYYLKESFSIQQNICQYLQSRKISPGSMSWYSYWSDELAFVLTRMKQSKIISNVISRTHNHDIYEDRHPSTYLPFRNAIFSSTNGILCISQHGRDYLSKKYPKHKEKFHCQRLGVENQTTLDRQIKDGPICLVSLSGIVPVKQIEYIINDLSRWNGRTIHWHHIGSAKSKSYGDAIEKMASEHLSKSQRVKHRFHGFIPPNEVISSLQKLNPHFLINASTFEGIPVSMMEAFSLGIPVIGPDVCGVPELVKDDNNGFLFDPSKPGELFDILTKLNDLEERDYQSMRQQAQRTQREKYSAQKNYERLVHTLKSAKQ